jgi:hypothetical protein
LGSLFSFAVDAFPAASLKQPTTSGVTLVRSFCGLGLHRGAHGYCIQNGSSVIYARPVYPSPDVITPLLLFSPLGFLIGIGLWAFSGYAFYCAIFSTATDHRSENVLIHSVVIPGLKFRDTTACIWWSYDLPPRFIGSEWRQHSSASCANQTNPAR